VHGTTEATMKLKSSKKNDETEMGEYPVEERASGHHVAS
jgi:hypothetical protein